MNKTERMYALVEELRAVAPRARSSSWLARRFEVSVRTIERDLAALQQSGVPIWAHHGRRGGYCLDASMTLPPLNFTPSEAAAIAVALAMAGPVPFGSAARSGMAKIVAAMSPAARDRAADIVSRVRVSEQSVHAPGQRIVSAVADALAERRLLEIDYCDRQGVLTRRAVEPVGFVALDQRWYLAAWCRLRDQRRAFRLDRIREAMVGLEPVVDRHRWDWDCDVPTLTREPAIIQP